MIKINRIRKKVSQFRWSLYSSLIAYATEAYPGEATRSFTTPPWLGYQSMTILLPPFLLGFPDNKPFLELLAIYVKILTSSAPMLWGEKQTKSIIHPSTSMGFLLFYFPKPRSQVWILMYRKWPIRRYPFILLSFSPMNDQARCQTQTFRLWPRPVFLTGQRKSSKTHHLCFYPSFIFNTNAVAWQLILRNPVERCLFENWAGHTLCLVWRSVTWVSILYTASLHTRV